MIRLIFITYLAIFSLAGSHAQNANVGQSLASNNRVGGNCENCELMYLGMPNEINSVDTSAGWNEKGQKLILTGTVFQSDGKTAAENVIIYYYHTDNNGFYSQKKDKPENQTVHGYIRGWVKSDKNGKYVIYTIRPAPYPDTENPSHIHLLVKESDLQNEYWIDELVFDDDKFVTSIRKKYPERNPRGGSGLLHVQRKDGLQLADHKIILGLNIPDYPVKK